MSIRLQDEIERALYGRRRSKYGVSASEDRQAHGITFDSKHERDTYLKYFALNHGGAIKNLQRQVRFPLCAPNGVVVSSYIADFTFDDGDGRHVIDAKGARTALYRMKKRWFEAQYAPLKIEEV